MAVFEMNDDIIGCLQISFIPGLSRRGALRGQIESVRVAANFRGNGYGTLMMAWAIEKCREQGCSLVQLTSDKTRKDAQRFYQELGFVQSHEGFVSFSPSELKVEIANNNLDGSSIVLNTQASTLGSSGDGTMKLKDSWAGKYL